MARMQVYLPDELYQAVKARSLPASVLLQKAVRAELRRLDLLAQADRYLAELVAEVGSPSPGQRARAAVVAGRVVARRQPRKDPVPEAVRGPLPRRQDGGLVRPYRPPGPPIPPAPLPASGRSRRKAS